MNQIEQTTDRRDNLFGVCAAIGDATGIDPILFRLAVVVGVLSGAFTVTIAAYCVAAVAIRVAQR